MANAVHPKEETANMVAGLVAAGLKQNDIARYLKISTATLHTHYKDALERGDTQVFAMVGSKIVAACQKGEPWALKLMANSRMGWSKKVETVPPGDAPDSSVSDLDAILDKATDAELDLINELINRPASGSPGPDTTTH